MIAPAPLKFLFFFLVVFSSDLMSDQEIFARQGETVLTQTELDAAFSRIPEVHRLAFIRDGNRVDQLVINLLRNKQVAQSAKENGFDKKPIIAARISMAAEKELAESWIKHVMDTAPGADFETMASEYYLANPDEFVTSGSLDVSHILISSETRADSEASEIADSLAEELAADPEKFDDFVLEYSEDPAMSSNGGRYPQMQQGQMVKPFEEAAYTLSTPGQISSPISTAYGYHIIRLNGINPPEPIDFESVKSTLIQRAQEKYLYDYRKNYLRKFSLKPIEHPDGAIETMVKRYFGEDLELAPDYKE